jgi:23S rRNA (cytidine2498-2'-O)-methyltransferase
VNPRFYFATCQIGAEKAVKAEVLAEHPALRFSFSRPGFVTFKQENSDGAALDLAAPVFTRLWGEVIDQTRDVSLVPAIVARIPENATVHCFDRDQYVPGDEIDGFARDRGVRSITGLPETTAAPPVEGSDVYDLVWVDDFHLFLGKHVHTGRLVADPGNIPALAVPETSPSRAWLKIEEAILRFRPVVQSGWKALEIGCAPGGASTALLDRGFTVTGIDPQFMAPSVGANPRFTHVRKPARFATESDLKGINPDWIVMDMSIPPADALGELSHVIHVLRGLWGKNLNIHRGFLTIKLNDWKYAPEIPEYLKTLNRIGFMDLKALQLAHNRQEFFVYSSKFRV